MGFENGLGVYASRGRENERFGESVDIRTDDDLVCQFGDVSCAVSTAEYG